MTQDTKRHSSPSQVTSIDKHHDPHQSHSESDKVVMQSVLGNIAGVLYAMLVVIIGICLQMIFYIRHSYEDESYDLLVFSVWTYGCSIVFLVYLRVTFRWKNSNDKSEQVVIANGTQIDKEEMRSIQTTNIYEILKMLVFGLAAILLDCFFLSSYFEDENSKECFSGWTFFPLFVMRIIFTALCLDFIYNLRYKHFNFHHVFIRFGLLHCIATNLCTWSLTVIMGTGHSLTRVSSIRLEQDSSTEPTVTEGSNTTGTVDCFQIGNISSNATILLLPFIIEFSIIAAMAFYKTYANVGKLPQRPRILMLNAQFEELYEERYKGCHPNLGILFGLFIFFTTLAFLIVFQLGYQNYDVSLGWFINPVNAYFTLTLPLLFISLFGSIYGLLRIINLHYLNNSDRTLDELLLIVSLSGKYLFLFFWATCSSHYTDHDDHSYYARFGVVTSVVGIIESTMQFIFVLNGLRRRTITRKQVTEAPGEHVVIFLIWINLSFWLFDSFTLRASSESLYLREFYGELAWVILANITLPLSIFFRFHIASLLSSIKIDSYYTQTGYRSACCKKYISNESPWIIKKQD